MTDTFLTQRELAERWGIKPRALEGRRARGEPPTYVRIGTGPRARVRYRLSDVEAFERNNTQGPK